MNQCNQPFWFSSILILTLNCSISAMELSTRKEAILPAAVQEKKRIKAIIFDIGGVFSKISISRYMSTMGLSTILWYSLVDRKVAPWALKNIFQERYFEVLRRADYELDPEVLKTRTTTGEEIPALLCAYQLGKISSKEVRELLEKTITKLKKENFFISETEEILVRRAIFATFTPEIHVEAQEIIPEAVEILKELAALKDENDERKFLLIALSNWDKESFALFKQKHGHIFDCFHTLYVSGERGNLKPNCAAFKAIFDAHGLRPDECMFVDDQIENIEAGAACGIVDLHLFVTKRPGELRTYLQKMGILSKHADDKNNGYKARTALILGVSIGLIAGLIYNNA